MKSLIRSSLAKGVYKSNIIYCRRRALLPRENLVTFEQLFSGYYYRIKFYIFRLVSIYYCVVHSHRRVLSKFNSKRTSSFVLISCGSGLVRWFYKKKQRFDRGFDSCFWKQNHAMKSKNAWMPSMCRSLFSFLGGLKTWFNKFQVVARRLMSYLRCIENGSHVKRRITWQTDESCSIDRKGDRYRFLGFTRCNLHRLPAEGQNGHKALLCQLLGRFDVKLLKKFTHLVKKKVLFHHDNTPAHTFPIATTSNLCN